MKYVLLYPANKTDRKKFEPLVLENTHDAEDKWRYTSRRSYPDFIISADYPLFRDVSDSIEELNIIKKKLWKA